jgi:hypothetical protein
MATERDTSYWRCVKCGSHWSQSRESAERCCKAGAAYVPCSCSRCEEAYTRLHVDAASSPAASGGTQEFTAAEVNEEIYALGGDRRHRQIRMLHQLARLLSPEYAEYRPKVVASAPQGGEFTAMELRHLIELTATQNQFTDRECQRICNVIRAYARALSSAPGERR